MRVVPRRRRRFTLLLLLFASCSLVFVIHRSPWQRFHIQFLNKNYLYEMSRPPDPTVCTDKTLFIGVGTGPKSFERRSSIRRSWAAELPDTAIMRFFVGQTEPATYAKLKEEERRFGDIVFCELPDGYDNLYLKASQDVHAMMQWQQRFCPQVAFLLKTDDDTTVHVTRLLDHIESRFRPAMNGTKAIFCSVKSYRWVFRERNSKWYVPRELFPDDVYPPFCTGFSYLLSSDAVAAILFGSHFVKAFSTEDALYTGVIAGKVGILRSSPADVFHYARLLGNVTKCDATGVALSSSAYIHDGGPAWLQADTLSFMKNQTCAQGYSLIVQLSFRWVGNKL